MMRAGGGMAGGRGRLFVEDDDLDGDGQEQREEEPRARSPEFRRVAAPRPIPAASR